MSGFSERISSRKCLISWSKIVTKRFFYEADTVPVEEGGVGSCPSSTNLQKTFRQHEIEMLISFDFLF